MKQISFAKGAKKPCAICHSRAHKGFLTAAAVKEHKCCEKNCPFLQKLEHDYWIQCERKRLEKRAMKMFSNKNITWTKTVCYKKVKELSLDELRAFVEKEAV